MSNKLARGGDLLRFFLSNNHYCAKEICGQATIYHNGDVNLLKPININNTSQILSSGYLKWTLSRGGFTEGQFWDFIENKGTKYP